MKLIAGLGNPGGKYARNRHNIGFMALDRLHQEHGFDPWRERFSGLLAEGRTGREKCLLLKPMTYMNESGQAVGKALRFYKLPLEDVLVIHDEIDLAPGKVRIKSGGGNAGHNGLRSISAHIGNDYMRLRLGVGRPPGRGDVARFVLRDFAKADHQWLEPLLDGLARLMPVLLEEGAPLFLNRLAEYLAPPAAPADAGGKSDEVKAKPDKSSGKSGAGAGEAKKGKKRPEVSEGAEGSGGPLADMLARWKKSRRQGGED